MYSSLASVENILSMIAFFLCLHVKSYYLKVCHNEQPQCFVIQMYLDEKDLREKRLQKKSFFYGVKPTLVNRILVFSNTKTLPRLKSLQRKSLHVLYLKIMLVPSV